MQRPQLRWVLTACFAAALGLAVSTPALAGDKGDKQDWRPDKQMERDGEHRKDKAKHKEQDKGKDHRADRDHFAKIKRMLFHDVDLSDEQQKQVRKIYHKHRKKRIEWFKKHRGKMHELGRKYHKAQRDDDKQAQKKARRQLHEIRESAPDWGPAVDAVRELLEDSQRKQFNDNLDRFKKRMEHWKKRWKGKHDHDKRKHDKRWDRDDRKCCDDKGKDKKHHKKDCDCKKCARKKDEDKHSKDRHHKDHRAKKLMHLIDDLELYKQQEEEIERLIRKHAGRPDVDEKFGPKAHRLRRAIYEERREDDHDSVAKLYEKLAEVYRDAAEYEKRHGGQGDLLDKVRSKLTGEQREAFEKKLKKMKKHHHDKDDKHRERDED